MEWKNRNLQYCLDYKQDQTFIIVIIDICTGFERAYKGFENKIAF